MRTVPAGFTSALLTGLLCLIGTLDACTATPARQQLSVSLSNTETYQHLAAAGDEEGASISVQARHFAVSEVRRDASTGWTATYIYQPAPGFVGSDRVVLDVFTNPDGTGPAEVNQVEIRFQVHN